MGTYITVTYLLIRIAGSSPLEIVVDVAEAAVDIAVVVDAAVAAEEAEAAGEETRWRNGSS